MPIKKHHIGIVGFKILLISFKKDSDVSTQ